MSNVGGEWGYRMHDDELKAWDCYQPGEIVTCYVCHRRFPKERTVMETFIGIMYLACQNCCDPKDRIQWRPNADSPWQSPDPYEGVEAIRKETP